MSDFSVENFLRILPGPIEKNEHLKQLSEVAARALMLCYARRRDPAIYSHINELPEELLDILARDFKVDWYEWNGNLETKRRQIKSNWYIHKRLGAVRGVEQALSDVWNNSTVEEWFEYGGNPGYFRVLIDATEPLNPIYIDSCYEKIRIYKAAGKHLEDNMVIVKITCGIVIETSKFSHPYHVPKTGTRAKVDANSHPALVDKIGYIPKWMTHGKKAASDIVVETNDLSATYHPPKTGQSTTGEYPTWQSHGKKQIGGLVVGAEGMTAVYTAKKCGTPLHSLRR